MDRVQRDRDYRGNLVASSGKRHRKDSPQADAQRHSPLASWSACWLSRRLGGCRRRSRERVGRDAHISSDVALLWRPIHGPARKAATHTARPGPACPRTSKGSPRCGWTCAGGSRSRTRCNQELAEREFRAAHPGRSVLGDAEMQVSPVVRDARVDAEALPRASARRNLQAFEPKRQIVDAEICPGARDLVVRRAARARVSFNMDAPESCRIRGRIAFHGGYRYLPRLHSLHGEPGVANPLRSTGRGNADFTGVHVSFGETPC